MNTKQLEDKLKKAAPLLRWTVRELVAELTPEPEVVIWATAWVNNDRLYADMALSKFQIYSMGEDGVIEWVLRNVSDSMASAIINWTPSPRMSSKERALEYAKHVWPGVSDKTRVEVIPLNPVCQAAPGRGGYTEEQIDLERANNIAGIARIGYGPTTDTIVIVLGEGGAE